MKRLKFITIVNVFLHIFFCFTLKVKNLFSKNEQYKSIKLSPVKFKTFFMILFFVITYICLNNYLIMFVYINNNKSSSITSQQLSTSTIVSTSVQKSNSLFIFESIFSYFEIKKSEEETYPIDYDDNDNDDKDDDEIKKSFSSLENDKEINTMTINDIILVDPDDFNEAGLNITQILEDDKNLIPLNSSYFIESLRKEENTAEQTSSVKRVCFTPKLNPFDSEIMQFVKREKNLKCNPKTNWVYVQNGTLRISKKAVKKHGQILCAYLPLYRGNNDFVVNEGKRIFPIMDHFPIITDFFKVDCRSKDGGVYSNIHSGISYDPSLHNRIRWNPMPSSSLGYNVLMFGFDSVSRMSFIRQLPKSYEYMLKQGFIVLKGYNIVGDGTPQNLLPILTGKKETEL